MQPTGFCNTVYLRQPKRRTACRHTYCLHMNNTTRKTLNGVLQRCTFITIQQPARTQTISWPNVIVTCVLPSPTACKAWWKKTLTTEPPAHQQHTPTVCWNTQRGQHTYMLTHHMLACSACNRTPSMSANITSQHMTFTAIGEFKLHAVLESSSKLNCNGFCWGLFMCARQTWHFADAR